VTQILLTGYPGFIGRRVVERLAARHPAARFFLLVEPRMREAAAARLEDANLLVRSEILCGDLVDPTLGLEHARERLSGVTHVWHLAAIYDLAVPASRAYAVNVDGTKHILDFCARLPNLLRLVYFSTVVVSGDRTGRVLESDLEAGQGFFNHYEHTKHLAEIEVRRRMPALPVTIIRPGVVVGDSKTGETDKLDGPYYAISAMVRARRALPLVGDGTAALHIVPVDYVVDGAVELSTAPEAVGGTFHMTDPEPPTTRDVFGGAAELLGYRLPRWHLPAGVGRTLARLPGVQSAFHMPRQLLDYVDHRVDYDTTNATRLLAPRGITCPRPVQYLPKLVGFVRENPRLRFLDGRRL
jgi:nucleoside-diphosphate-sugar epimerase